MSRNRITGSRCVRINGTGPFLPGKTESRNTSCRLTTRCMEATQSSGEMRPRTLITQQIWFDTWAGGARDVSHNSRCGKVSGWRQASPLASHCLNRARLSSVMRAFLQYNVLLVAEELVDLFVGKGVEINFNRGRSRVCYGNWCRCRRSSWRHRAAYVASDQTRNLTNSSRAHQTRRGKSDTDGQLERILDLDAHQ